MAAFILSAPAQKAGPSPALGHWTYLLYYDLEEEMVDNN